ncbi:MAG: argininosuccinate lyase [Acidobacteria bacterium]|nr:argininosuccinate lyase [Acidobacteriota bacterium]
MSQLWRSQINQGMAPQAWALNRSIDRDYALWPHELLGSKAHVDMLDKTELLSQEQARALREAIDELACEFANRQIEVLESDEDIHGLVERLLVERLGPWASMVHMGRSRNEQVLLDERLYLLENATTLRSKLQDAIAVLVQMADRADHQMVPSYTHLRRAQPMFLRQYWIAHATWWSRCIEDLDQYEQSLLRECPMGSGAINGTTLPTNPHYEAHRLGFEGPPSNALATVSSRADVIRFAAIWTHWMLEVSRLMEDLILWTSDEFGFASFSGAVTSGSSMMPQKRNPDICELIRGKSAVVMGYYTGLMTLTKGLPMGYMKDFQEDKTLLLPLVGDMHLVLDVMPVLLQALHVNAEAMSHATEDPLLLATDVMEVLVRRGMPLREAHRAIGDCIAEAIQENVSFAELATNRWQLSPETFHPQASCLKRDTT